MQAGSTPQPTPKESRKKSTVIAAVVIAAVLAILLIMYPVWQNITGSSSSTPPPTAQTFTLVASGTVYSLNAGYYLYVNFSVPYAAYSIDLGNQRYYSSYCLMVYDCILVQHSSQSNMSYRL